MILECIHPVCYWVLGYEGVFKTEAFYLPLLIVFDPENCDRGTREPGVPSDVLEDKYLRAARRATEK